MHHKTIDILRYIETHFTFMASSSCIPIKVALQLMDSSSLGLASEQAQFNEAHLQLQNALKVIVNEHHQGFNSSIGTFHKIQQAIHASQHRVRTLRAGLIQAKSALATQRPELKVLAIGSQGYEGMLQVLATIEELMLVPDQLEAQIREKRYLGAVDNLLAALKLIRKPELEDIGALSELRVRLSNQDQILTDMLVEELHNHLYLKSPYCEERWKSHAKRPQASSTSEERAMYRFLAEYDGSTPMQEDSSRNAEADTFYFIQLLIEALNKMGKIDVAADRVEERLPIEFHRLLERTLSEVEQRHPNSVRTNNLARFRQSETDRKVVLEDLLTTLYAKFEAIAESHRVMHHVTAAVLKRDLVPSAEAATLNRSFRELWKLIQAEMRSLLHDHLATNSNFGGQGRKAKDASANIFKFQPRDRSRKFFKAADTLDRGKSSDLATEREDLEFILKASVPGLVSAKAITASASTDRETDISATGHKLLVEPSVFNMANLLQPSLAFLTALKDIVPPDSSAVPGNLTSFLDDFLVNVFYPQLEESLLELCAHNFTDSDAFTLDPTWTSFAQKPVFKGTKRFYDLIERFCRMLMQLPHEQSFSQLVISQMRDYYDRCFAWSRSLLQRVQMTENGDDASGEKMRLAAELATEGEVNEIEIELLKDDGKNVDLAKKEADLLLRIAKSRELEDADLIQDRKTLAALCTLQVSMKWLTIRFQQLRYLSPHASDSQLKIDRWAATKIDTAETSLDDLTYLPLSAQTASEFDAVTTSYTSLSALVLRTLHVDLRLHLIQGIYRALDTTYALSQPYNDPEPHILALSTDLSSYDTVLTTHILPAQHSFLTLNISISATTALTSLVSSIAALDLDGLARMSLNILVLQSTLKNLSPSSDLIHAARFYELAAQGPQAVVEQGPNEGYAREDLKALCRLCWNDERDRLLGDKEAFVGRLGGWPKRQASLKGRKGGMGSRTASAA